MNEIKVLDAIIQLLEKGERATRDSVAEYASVGSATVPRSIKRLNAEYPKGLGMSIRYVNGTSTNNGSYQILDYGMIKAPIL